MLTSLPSGPVVGEVGEETATEESVSLRESGFYWGKNMRRESSLKRLEDVGILFTIKEGFQQAQGERMW